jgi:hypothetical protein
MPEDTLDRIIEKAVKETTPRTIQLRVSIAQTARKTVANNGPSSLTLEQAYFETARGERFLDERRITPDGPISHMSSYCDGTKCANVRFSKGDPDKQDSVTIGHDFMNEVRTGFRDAPQPLRYYHVGLMPLHEALHQAEREGQVRVIQRICNNFRFKRAGPRGPDQSLVYSLDEQTSVPLRVAAYYNPDQLRSKAPNWVWEAKTLDEASGRHFVRTSTFSSFLVKKADTDLWVSEPSLSQTIQVEEITFDAAIPRTSFWPTTQPGTRVSDTIAKRKFQVPGGKPSTRESAGTGTPVRVAPESDSVSWLSGAGVVLSLAVLAAAAVIWRRSR